MCCEGMVSGRECSVQSEAEVVRAVGRSRSCTGRLRGIAIDESWNLGSILTRPAVAEMERHNRELVRTRNYIRKKRRNRILRGQSAEALPSFMSRRRKQQAG